MITVITRITADGHEVRFPVKVTPNCSAHQGILPFQSGDTAIRLRINAPAEGGKANKAVIAFFSKALRIPKSSVSIVSGETARLKTIALLDAEFELFKVQLAQLVSAVPSDCIRHQASC
tara:strand:- start:11 stop:367 length:357 start_codon:yes stop_codon:yes gene_type:complete